MTNAITVYEVYDNHYINRDSAEYIIENYGNHNEYITVKEWDGEDVYVISGDMQIQVNMDSMVKISEDDEEEVLFEEEEEEEIPFPVLEKKTFILYYSIAVCGKKDCQSITVQATNYYGACHEFRKVVGYHGHTVRFVDEF